MDRSGKRSRRTIPGALVTVVTMLLAKVVGRGEANCMCLNFLTLLYVCSSPEKVKWLLTLQLNEPMPRLSSAILPVFLLMYRWTLVRTLFG